MLISLNFGLKYGVSVFSVFSVFSFQFSINIYGDDKYEVAKWIGKLFSLSFRAQSKLILTTIKTRAYEKDNFIMVSRARDG